MKMPAVRSGKWRWIVPSLAMILALVAVRGQETRTGRAEAEARHRVFTGLRALVHEGCVSRGVQWSGPVTPGRRVLVPLFLFKENDYFLVVAPGHGEPALELKCEIRDVVGVIVPSTEIRGKDRVVVSVRPKVSGSTYVSLSLPEGADLEQFAIGYAYQ